ncbi:MAG TPA: right-handed parallel beta-helix repeat-containing protein [Kofleriaceae bacterium]
MRIGITLICLLAPAVANAETYEIFPTDDLFARLRVLAAGDEVIVHAGTYTTPGFFQVTWTGTEASPITVRAADGERPVIVGTPAQNVIDLDGSYFTLRGFEIRGGSHGVRLAATDHAVLEDLVIHDLGDVGISCNRPGLDCSSVTIRRNEIFDTGKAGPGEGMYLGCNDATCIFRDSIVEHNYVHDIGGDQGDGIEVKTGASGVIVRDNVIVRTKYPGITMYGFAGTGMPNVVERNLVWTTIDNGIQIVGQVRVRNNIVIAAGTNGIQSKASQGHTPDDLEIVNNTIVGAGVACLKSNDWATATGQLVANNAVYCDGKIAIDLNGGAPNAMVVANVGLGTANVPTGFALGRSVAEDLGDPAIGDVYPRAGSPLEGTGDAAHATTNDFDGCPRDTPVDIGAYERSPEGRLWAVAEAFKPAPSCGGTASDAGPVADGGIPVGASTGCCNGHSSSSVVPGLLVGLAMLARRRRSTQSGLRA